jgi:hypothetical protein
MKILETDDVVRVAGHARCAACGEDVQQVGGKPVKVVSLPAEVRWQEARTPAAALAIVRKARAEGIQPKAVRVLCCRCWAELTSA